MAAPRENLVFLLGKRFLFSKHSGNFVALITWVSIAGVALGVLALTVVTSVINGFEGELTRVITGVNGDIVLYTRGSPFRAQEEMEAKIRSVVPEIEALTPAFVTQLMVSGPGGVSGAVLNGVDFKSTGAVTEIPERLVAGKLPEKNGEWIVASELAERIDVKVGDVIRLILPFVGEGDKASNESVDHLSPRAVEGKVVGIASLGMYQYDSKFVYGSLTDVQDFLKEKGRITSYNIKLKHGASVERATEVLSDHFGYPFRAKHWGELNKNVLYAIRLEKVVIAILLTAIVIVAAFNVVSTLMMMIHDKAKEMAILKAMGFPRQSVFMLFCAVGGGIGAAGVVLGIVAGLGLNEVIASTRLIDLPADVYYIGFLPVVVRWNEIALIGLLALGICLLAAMYPARRIARRSPLEGIRYEN